MSSRRESNPNLDRSRPDLYNDTTTNQRINRLRDLRNKLDKEALEKNTLPTENINETNPIESNDISRRNILKGIFETLKKNQKNINTGDDNKKIEDSYTSEEYNYYIKLDNDEREYYLFIENSIKTHNKSDIPLRFKVLDKEINLDNKSIIIKKIDDHNKSKFSLGGENSKFNNWLTGLLKIPFGEYKKLPITKDNTKQEICDYLTESQKKLDEAVYGHTTTKNQIIQLITQWITNPDSGGNVIGIQGPMGNGKTTLVKEGVSKAVDRPFAFITLGGCSDSSFLEGHNYTYEGSQWGRVVDVLIQSQCMNPIFYFDELDKVSQTKRGEEIINMLIHLTDSSQNTQFQDKYFSGIDIDISKSIFIFSYNDPSKISPILLDRLLNIKTDGFEKEGKVTIAKQYLITGILKQLGMDKDTIEISDEVIEYIIDNYTKDEKGVRTLKKNLELIHSKLNVLILTQGSDIFNYDINISKLPLKLTNENVDTLLKEFEDDQDKEFSNYLKNTMYM